MTIRKKATPAKKPPARRPTPKPAEAGKVKNATPTIAWPADKVERRAVADLVPYARNARLHDDKQVQQIAASIREFGWTVPVLVDEDGGLIAGHGRVLAAKKLGIVDIPVMVATGWSEAQKRAYVLADNKLTLNGEWDEDLLKIELASLEAADFDLGLTGFSDAELKKLLDDALVTDADPEAMPSAPSKPVTVLGDVWLLGPHRLVCGDSTTVEAVDKALAGAKPHLMVTDPPYGVEYDPNWRDEKEPRKEKRAAGQVLNDDQADWKDAIALFSGDVAYVWHAGLTAPTVADSLVANGFVLRAQIIWDKINQVLGRGDYHWQHEAAWYAVRKGKIGHWNGDRKQTTVWQINREKSETGHGTQKPVECMRRPIETNSLPGDGVYEPFSGSGTTLIACESTGRMCHAIELNPAYVDLTVLRWQDYAKQVARIESTGQTFLEVMAERVPDAVIGLKESHDEHIDQEPEDA
jgi:DNA modification methylase